MAAPAKKFEEEQSVPLPIVHVRAAVVPESVDVEARTVEVVFSTGAAVLRYDWRTGEEYYEVLEISEKAIRMDFLNEGAPFLADHNAYSVRSVLGVIERAWVQGKEARALVRFDDEDEDAVRIWRKVAKGILRFVSVGYIRRKMRDDGEKRDGRPVRTVTEWEPMEISQVAIPADRGAKVRSEGAGGNELTVPCLVVRSIKEDETTMAKKNAAATEGEDLDTRNNPEPGTAGGAPSDPAGGVDVAAERAAAERAERNRVTEIMDAVRKANLPVDFATRLISEGVTIDAARSRIIDEWAKAGAKGPQHSSIAATDIRAGELDEVVTRREGMARAVLSRFSPNQYKLQGDDHVAREYRGFSLLDLARECLESRGVRTRGMSRMELAGMALNVRGYHSTSDFPEILANVIGKSLRDAYDLSPRTFTVLGRQATLPDYKEISRVQLGEAPSLERVAEGAEYTYGTIGEAAEKYRLFKYGRIFSATREMIINDDLDAFTRIPALFGRSAADLESDLFWNIITSNAVMADGKQLFSEDHANLITPGGPISVAQLGAMRAKLRTQRGIDGKKRLNISARYLVVPAALETEADKHVSAIVANRADNVNVFAGRLETIAEPRLDDASETAWYLWADPAAIDTIEYAYLEGEEGVQIETMQGFDVDGVKVKARLDFGVKAIDHRGFARNDGIRPGSE